MLDLLVKIAVRKEYNIARHNNTKHSCYAKLEGQLHFHQLEVSCQQSLRKSDFFSSDCATKASMPWPTFLFGSKQTKIVKTVGRSRLRPGSHVLFQWRSKCLNKREMNCSDGNGTITNQLLLLFTREDNCSVLLFVLEFQEFTNAQMSIPI